MSYKEIVPKAFWHDSEPTPVVRTVGDLIDELTRLPRELELTCGFSDAAQIVLYNIDKDGMHVEICEVDECDDDDWPDDKEES